MEFPRKLNPDGIVEALLEIRFETGSLPELTIGNLVSRGPWKGYAATRLPAAEIPHFVRANDPNLKFQPTLQLNSPTGNDVVKVGENVLSTHRLGAYPGWVSFGPSLHQSMQELFQAIDDLRVTRLGFRYVNLLGTRHGISTFSDLACNLSVGGQELAPPINLNYLRAGDGNHKVVVRAASPEFVQGPNRDFSVLVDIDVFTEDAENIVTIDDCGNWLEKAHIILKQRFFELLSPATIEQLKEE